GLGIQFLRHLSRTKILLHLVDILPIDGSDPVEAVNTVMHELSQFGGDLAQKERWLVFNKADLMLEEEAQERAKEIATRLNWQGPIYLISSVQRRGTAELAQHLMNRLESDRVI